MYNTLITILFLGAMFLWAWRLTQDRKLKGILRTGLRAADNYKPGGRDEVRIPYNQLAQILDWKSENFPMRDPKDFTSKPTPHPAGESATKRTKRRR